jgi:hypothetical protein
MTPGRPTANWFGEETKIDALFKLMPHAATSEWRDDLAQLQRWHDAAIIGQRLHYPACFWPAFVECDDCVFLAARSPGSLLQIWLDREHGDRRAVEADLNSFYAKDFFTCHPAEPTRDQVIWLSRLVRKMWGWKLRHEFPHRNILVAFDEEAEDVLRSFITFYQVPANAQSARPGGAEG